MKREKYNLEEDAEEDDYSKSDTSMIDFAEVLEDFLDQEVVDRKGKAVGTLACYWESASGRLIFLGVEVKGQDGVRVIPGRRSYVDDRQACIRLGFNAKEVETAPRFDCDQEMDVTLERAVYEHFQMTSAQSGGELTQRTRASIEASRVTGEAGSKD